MRLAHFLLGLALVTGCNESGEDASSSTAAATATTESAPVTLDCRQPGSFPEEAMLGIGDGTYVRAGDAPPNSLRSFTLGPLVDIPGWAGKNASYTRDMTAPCMDVVAIGDGSGLRENSPLPMTETACAGQTGRITVLMDNPMLGAVIAFEDASGLPFGNDTYFVTGSQLDGNGKAIALCLSHASGTGPFLVTRR